MFSSRSLLLLIATCIATLLVASMFYFERRKMESSLLFLDIMESRGDRIYVDEVSISGPVRCSYEGASAFDFIRCLKRGHLIASNAVYSVNASDYKAGELTLRFKNREAVLPLGLSGGRMHIKLLLDSGTTYYYIDFETVARYVRKSDIGVQK